MSLDLSKAKTLRTLICEKLLTICFYHSRCFGTLTYCISHSNSHRSHNGFALHAYEHKSLMWLTIVIRLLGSVVFYYATFILLKVDDVFFNSLRVLQITTVVFSTVSIAISQMRCSKRSVIAINNLFKLIHCVRQLHPNYEIYKMSHLVLLAVKMMCIIYELACMVEVGLSCTALSEGVLMMINIYLMLGVWVNLHIACILYIFIDALFGAFNHYMSSSFLVKIREAQECGNKSLPPAQVKQFISELERISQIYYDIHRVGIELHNILQFPVAASMLFIEHTMLGILYFLTWKYFESNVVFWYYIPFLFKLTVDIALLSLAAHKAIKSSHIICRIGLDNIIFPENKDWHRNMELFLYHINLYDFKLNILGFFDITNALTLTFIAGILTVLTIFIPFAMKDLKMKEILTSN